MTSPTATAGANTTKECLAAPGYLFDKFVAKPCTRGTWKDTFNTQTFCNRCPLGLNTAQTASISQSNCTQAMAGFRVVTPTVSAERCPLNSYNPGGNSLTCIPCPDGLVTLITGARSVSSCLAPPGWGFNVNSGTAAPCALHSFKAGFNRKGCQPCGSGFLTQATGSDSRQRCYLPAGHGTVSENGVTRAVKCVKGLFGFASDSFGATSRPCRACQAGMTTMDSHPTLGSNYAATMFTSPSSCVTWPGYGYDKMAQAAKICEAGTYSEGWTLEPCSSCGEGQTTATLGTEVEGGSSSGQCVIAPGFHHDPQADVPVPCEIGFYCPGLTSTAAAIPCPTGTTTSVAAAKAVSECNGEFN